MLSLFSHNAFYLLKKHYFPLVELFSYVAKCITFVLLEIL